MIMNNSNFDEISIFCNFLLRIFFNCLDLEIGQEWIGKHRSFISLLLLASKIVASIYFYLRHIDFDEKQLSEELL